MTPATDATAQPCTLENYCQFKKLSPEKVASYGVRDDSYNKQTRLRISYCDESGEEKSVRYRMSLNGANKFKWKTGDKTMLYGIDRLNYARQEKYILIVEGESCAHSAWEHNLPATGIPGAGTWKPEWSNYLEGIDSIYFFIENDQGGATLLQKLEQSSCKDRVKLVFCNESWKDLSALHCEDPIEFPARLSAILGKAITWQEYETVKAQAQAKEAWEQCKELAQQKDILAEFDSALVKMGVVGVSHIAKIIYLALVSRLLDRPVSIAVKAVSSAGKSFVAEKALSFFPSSAYYELSAMSERVLAFTEESLEHRFLVMFEATGMEGEMASYFIRSLLSEGRIRYETVQSTRDGLKPLLVEKKGPSGLLVTTTKVKLHPENETRLLSLNVPDTPEQTRLIIDALATEDEREQIDMAPWHALQTWLAAMGSNVTIPYAKQLGYMVPEIAVRLRRDFRTVLALIRAHALLHQATRERDDKGRVIATFIDYKVIRDFVFPFIAEGLEATVSEDVRATVEALRQLKQEESIEHVTYVILAKKLGLRDRSTGQRRAKKAISLGYITNEAGKGKPASLKLGDDMPEDQSVLPTAEELQECCSVAPVAECTTHTATNADIEDIFNQIVQDDEQNAQPLTPCSACGNTDYSERSSAVGGGWVCNVCHPTPNSHKV